MTISFNRAGSANAISPVAFREPIEGWVISMKANKTINIILFLFKIITRFLLSAIFIERINITFGRSKLPLM